MADVVLSVLLQQLNQSCRRQHREDDVNARCRRSNFFFSNVTKCNDDEMDRKMNMRGANNVGTAGTIAIVLLGFLHCCCDNNVVAFSLIARHRPEHYLPNQRIRRNRGACGWGLHNGGIRRALVWPSKAPKASGDAEEGDSSGEQEGPSSPPSLYSELDRSFAYEGRLRGSEYGNYRCGFVSILGAPNMGKSTLLNALLREDLCIATARPQTTRHAILGLLTTDSVQVCLVDTPGVIDEPAYKLQEGMMEAVVGAFQDADVLLVVTDLFSSPIPDDELFRKVRISDKPVIVAINKVDLASKVNADSPANKDKTVTAEQAVRFWRELLPDAIAILPMAASNGPDDAGVAALRRLLTGGPDLPAAFRDMGRPIPGMFRVGSARDYLTDEEAQALLPKSPPLYDQEALTDRTERFVASEIIRASLFETLKKELPYCCEVRVTQFKEPKQVEEDGSGKKKSKAPVLRIEAQILVERDSQKIIVIGKGGEQIKKVGMAARKKLEEFFQTKVYLDLNVKVSKDWRKDKGKLKEYGYL